MSFNFKEMSQQLPQVDTPQHPMQHPHQQMMMYQQQIQGLRQHLNKIYMENGYLHEQMRHFHEQMHHFLEPISISVPTKIFVSGAVIGKAGRTINAIGSRFNVSAKYDCHQNQFIVQGQRHAVNKAVSEIQRIMLSVCFEHKRKQENEEYQKNLYKQQQDAVDQLEEDMGEIDVLLMSTELEAYSNTEGSDDEDQITDGVASDDEDDDENDGINVTCSMVV